MDSDLVWIPDILGIDLPANLYIYVGPISKLTIWCSQRGGISNRNNNNNVAGTCFKTLFFHCGSRKINTHGVISFYILSHPQQCIAAVALSYGGKWHGISFQIVRTSFSQNSTRVKRGMIYQSTEREDV